MSATECRWIIRNGEKILQQRRWGAPMPINNGMVSIAEEWEDVPIWWEKPEPPTGE